MPVPLESTFPRSALHNTLTFPTFPVSDFVSTATRAHDCCSSELAIHACPRAGYALSSFFRALFPSSSVNRNPRETRRQPWPFHAANVEIRRISARPCQQRRFSKRSRSSRTFLHTGPVTDLLNATGFRTRVCGPFLVTIHPTVHRSSPDRLVSFPRDSDSFPSSSSSFSFFFFFFLIHDPRRRWDRLLVSRFLASLACRRERDEKQSESGAVSRRRLAR